MGIHGTQSLHTTPASLQTNPQSLIPQRRPVVITLRGFVKLGE